MLVFIYFFGVWENLVFCFRDLLTFSNMQEKLEKYYIFLGIAHDMKAKAKDLSEAEKEYFEVQQHLKDVKKDAKETLEYIMRGMERDKKKHIKNRDEAMKKYANYSKRLSKMIKEESVKIQSKLDKMEKEAQNEIDERKK